VNALDAVSKGMQVVKLCIIKMNSQQVFNISCIRLENAYSHPQNEGFLGISSPKWGVDTTRPLKGTSLHRNMSYHEQIVKIGLQV